MVLPAGGRKGRAPAWPIKTARVPAVWAELWKSPQAAAWEKLGYHRIVARYALLLSQVEKPAASARLLNEVRQLEDRLGLTPMAMLRLRWEVSEKDRAEHRSGAETKRPDGAHETVRRRLKIVG